MLDRNLEITRKEKEKRGFSLGNNTRGPVVNNQETNTETNDKKLQDDSFKKMLDRNLEITRKEKEKRGFSLNNNKEKTL